MRLPRNDKSILVMTEGQACNGRELDGNDKNKAGTKKKI